ncbi:MAG: hypothetical protein ICV87_00725 [Gemmatimonadetes bacterium]|nr:hypothetical protein [Gemmatimonadota bacterium]
MPNRTMRRLLPALLLALAACSGDDDAQTPAPPEQVQDAEVMMDAPQPQITPAESAAVVQARAARSDSITRAVRGEPTRTEPARTTVQDELALCRTQAAQAEGVVREHLTAACARIEERAKQ